MLNLYTLSQFKKVAETEHITKASEELHIAQSSLSRKITSLEEELGVQLFDRVGKNIVLNDYGRIVLRHTEIMLREEEAIYKELQDLQGQTESVVRISMQAATKLLSGMVIGFQEEYPDIHLEIYQSELTKDMEESCDLTIFSEDVERVHGKNTTLLLAEEVYLGLPLNHPLTKFESIDLRLAKDLEFICLPKGKAIRTLTDNVCAEAGFEPKIRIECDSPETVRQLISLGQGVSFVPAITWKGTGSDKMVLRPLSYPTARRYMYISSYENAYLSRAARLFRNYIVKYFASLVKEAGL